MLVLRPVILKHTPPPPSAPEEAARQDGPDRNGRASDRPARSITARPGETYSYPAPRIGLVGGLNSSIGAFLTELLGAGIGEVIVPQLLKMESRSRGGRGRDIGFHGHREHRFDLFYPGNSPDFLRRRQCHPVECSLLYNSGGHHQGSDRPVATGPHRAANHGKSAYHIFGLIGVAMMWIVIA